MTTLQAPSHSESPKTGAPSNTKPLAELLAEFEGDGELQAVMTDARKSLAQNLYADEPQSLSALRLAAGLSQRQLACRMETSQPYIARLEAGSVDPGTDVVTRLAAALGVPNNVVLDAVIYQRGTRGDNG